MLEFPVQPAQPVGLLVSRARKRPEELSSGRLRARLTSSFLPFPWNASSRCEARTVREWTP